MFRPPEAQRLGPSDLEQTGPADVPPTEEFRGRRRRDPNRPAER